MDDFLDRHRLLVILILLLIIAGGLAALYLRWPRGSAGLAADSSSPFSRSSQPVIPVIKTPDARQPTLKVFVTGAVATPGVYAFREGDRVEDALKAAGGTTADADLSRLNLAQRLRDEGQVVVPSLKDTPGPVGQGSGGATPAVNRPLNINTATLADLDALPGIGATYAQRIIDYRTKNGPFQKTSDLVDSKILPASTFDKIKDLVDVR